MQRYQNHNYHLFNMAHRQLKSDQLHHYQKGVYPFWRREDNKGFYSEETKRNFEKFKAEFELAMRQIQWTKK